MPTITVDGEELIVAYIPTTSPRNYGRMLVSMVSDHPSTCSCDRNEWYESMDSSEAVTRFMGPFDKYGLPQREGSRDFRIQRRY